MTTRVCILTTILGLGVMAGLCARTPVLVRAESPQAPQPAAGQRQPGTYPLGPDSLPQDGVPKGKLDGPFLFKSQIIAGTVRRYWIYVPAQYTGATPANVLVFQDGQRATNPTGSLRVPQVLENLIHKKDIPVTIGIFITPGQRGDVYPEDVGTGNPNNRAAEYDSLSDAYARFIVDEMLPEVAKTYNITKDPAARAIGGTSSGAICAFTVAWHRPDQFKNVISMIGSYTSIGYRPAAGRSAHGAGRRSLSDPHPEEPDQADQDLPAGWVGRPRQPARQLVPRESTDARRIQLREYDG